MNSGTERAKASKVHDSVTHDPLMSVHIQSDVFNRAWLTNERPLTRLQQVGFLLFSLGFVSAGLFCGQGMWESLKESDLAWALLWLAGAAAFIPLGMLGLVRALRNGPGGKP
jgi:hypothetical protein